MKHLKVYSLTSFFVLSLFGFFAVADYVKAIEYSGLGISPNVSEVISGNALSKAWFIYTLPPGTVKAGKVDITNGADVPIVVDIYPVDAVTTKDGAFAPQSRDRELADVGRWVTLSETELYLAPKEKKIVDFTINVPSGVSVGDHMGAIIAQNKKTTSDSSASGMRITTRVGARMYITVPGDIIKALQFEEFTARVSGRKGRTVTFYTTLTNTGNTRIRVSGVLEIINSLGETVEIVPLPEREVFPSKTIVVPVKWAPRDSTFGEITAIATVDYDDKKTLSKEVSLSLPGIKRPSKLLALVSDAFPGSFGLGVLFSALLILALFLAPKAFRIYLKSHHK